MRFFDKYTKIKKILCLVLVSVMMTTLVGGYSLNTRAREDKFEASIAAFPESYKPLLRELHKTHPNWTFIAFDTGLDWDVVLKNQMKLSRNLMPNGTMGINGKWFKTPTSWKDITINGSYSWTANDWVELCGGGWVQASTEAVEYIMDPRNWITEENVFAFEMLSFNEEYQTYEVLKSMMENTFMDCDYAIVGGTEPEPPAEQETTTKETESSENSETIPDETTGEDVSDTATEGENNTAESATGNPAKPGETEKATKPTTPEANEKATKPGESEKPTKPVAPGEAEKPTKPVKPSETEKPTKPSKRAGETSEGDATESELNETEETTAESPVSKGKTYAEVLLEAGKLYGVSPIHLCARLIQEKGRGVYNSATGQYELKDKLASGRIGSDGKIYYNFFNIGANGSTTEAVLQNGTNEAQKEGWDSQYKAIMGGASKVANNYIKIGQDTVYFQKFSVVNPAYYYWKQYMQNLLAPVNEGYNMRKTYNENGILESDFVFRIPIYNNMPEKICPMPEGDGNPNYKLNGISVAGITIDNKAQNLTLTPTFNMDVDTYSAIVPYDIEKIEILASAIAKDTSKVTGTGSKTLEVGKNTFKIICESEYGPKKEYTINITRSEGSMYLSTISTSAGLFEEDFVKNRYEYSLIVNNSVEVIDLFYGAESNTAYVEYRIGETIKECDSGTISGIKLTEGENKIYLDVYPSRDSKKDKKTYCITITRRIKVTFNPMELQTNDETGIINGFVIGDTVETALSKMEVINGTAVIMNSAGQIKDKDSLIGTGDVLKILDDGGLEYRKYTIMMYGDVNGDGKTDLFDFAYMKKQILKKSGLEGIYMKAADTYPDSEGLDLFDIAVIKRYILKNVEIPQLR